MMSLMQGKIILKRQRGRSFDQDLISNSIRRIFCTLHALFSKIQKRRTK